MKTYPGSTDSKQQGTGRREDAGALAKCKKKSLFWEEMPKNILPPLCCLLFLHPQ